MKKLIGAVLLNLVCFIPLHGHAMDIDEVIFFTRVQTYEAIVDTTLVTQEGKRIPIAKGTRLNVAGFTKAVAFVISRSDKPNGFVSKADVAPLGRRSYNEPKIREETLSNEPPPR